jgi:hypothetical protein
VGPAPPRCGSPLTRCPGTRRSRWARPRSKAHACGRFQQSCWPTASTAAASTNRGNNYSPTTTPRLARSGPPNAATSPWDGEPKSDRPTVTRPRRQQRLTATRAALVADFRD